MITYLVTNTFFNRYHRQTLRGCEFHASLSITVQSRTYYNIREALQIEDAKRMFILTVLNYLCLKLKKLEEKSTSYLSWFDLARF